MMEPILRGVPLKHCSTKDIENAKARAERNKAAITSMHAPTLKQEYDKYIEACEVELASR